MDGIGLDETVTIALAMPAVVDDDVAVSGRLHAAGHHGIGSRADDLFVDLAADLVPAVPAHRRSQGQAIKFLRME